MKRYILIFIALAGGWKASAQNIPHQTFISGGTATFSTEPGSSFGTIGQRVVMPQVVSTENGDGVAVDLVFRTIDAPRFTLYVQCQGRKTHPPMAYG